MASSKRLGSRFKQIVCSLTLLSWNELAVWVDEMGIPAMDVISSATYWPAVFMHVDDIYGTIAIGEIGAIIAVKGDALRYINLLQDVKIVMKDGVSYKCNGQVI